MISMENLGNGGKVACKISLGPLRNSSTTPGDEHVLRQSGVRVFDFDEGELDTAFVEVLD